MNSNHNNEEEEDDGSERTLNHSAHKVANHTEITITIGSS